MLKIFKLNLNRKDKVKVSDEQANYCKYYPVSTREWNNSIYLYNKNALNLIPDASVLAIKIIKSYFNIFNNKLERQIRKKRLLVRLRRLSSNKIYLSNGEFKHTNNKIVITLYLFNRQKHIYITRLKKIYDKLFKKTKNKLKINKIFEQIKREGLESLKKANKNKYILLKILKSYNLNNKQATDYKGLSDYITNFYKKLVKKTLKSLKFYLYYRQLLFINKSKFNYTYLQFLKKYLEKIYNKNVEFNLVNLRRFYLNSDILSESITLKIRKNRKKLLKFLSMLKKKVKIKEKNKYYEIIDNISLKLIEKKSLEKIALENIKYKHVTGFRLQANGRLTRRYTASRSVSKLRYLGNLLNLDCSYKNLSSTVLRGNLRSNLQYTKLKSKTRIGSFGIKGWVSGN